MFVRRMKCSQKPGRDFIQIVEHEVLPGLLVSALTLGMKYSHQFLGLNLVLLITMKRFISICIAINLFNFLRAPEIYRSLYAEDVRIFLPERIELGVMQSLFEQHSGYLNLYPRIIFALASSVSLEHTPLFVAIAVNSSTALLLLLVLS